MVWAEYLKITPPMVDHDLAASEEEADENEAGPVLSDP
jgi:hypothetical protein